MLTLRFGARSGLCSHVVCAEYESAIGPDGRVQQREPPMTFQDLGIARPCLSLLEKQGITNPTPVQAQAIPPAREGRDVIAVAQTGTGKTLAFGLPALTRLRDGRGAGRMLVLTPTRELAQQVHRVLDAHGRPLGLRAVCIYGGAGMDRQAKELRQGADVVVATPGRLLDHLSRGNARFSNLQVLVLDEADRMLDMGFMPDIRRIVKGLPVERQTLLFSATFPREIQQVAATIQRDPVRIEVGSVAPAKAIRQQVYTVQSTAKLELLSELLRQPDTRSTLVFLRTKHRTDRLAKALDKAGFKVQAIHGGRSQGQRERAIDGFRKGRFNVLLATDVAARGLDVQGITHVINYDIPACTDDYIHRIGRTARATAEGEALTFVCPEDRAALRSIEKGIGRPIPRFGASDHAEAPVPGNEPAAAVRPEARAVKGDARPRRPQRQRQRRGQRRATAPRPAA